VLRRLASESIAFHAVSLASSSGGTTSRINNNVLASRERLNSMAAGGEGDRERNRLLEQGTAVTGGSRQRLASTLALAGALDRLMRELTNGYRVTFRRSGTDRAKDLQVGVLIEGVTLRATAAPFGTR
jgi:hypothetical protein